LNQLVGIAAGGPIAFSGTTANPITQATLNVTQAATVSGTSVTLGDALTVAVHNRLLSQAENVDYTITSNGEALSSIASGIAAAINADTTLQSLGVSATSASAVVTIASSSLRPTYYTAFSSNSSHEALTLGGRISAKAQQPSSSKAFSGSPSLASGANSVSITALSGGGTAGSGPYLYPVTINSVTPATLSFDACGNLVNDGTNSYSWDADNRLVEITYPGTGNNSQFSYDASGRCVKIVENGTSPSFLNPATMNFVWCGNQRCEARDGSGNVLAQYFTLGETQWNGSSLVPYSYTRDHLGSVRELTNSSDTVEMAQSFDPFGRVTKLSNAGSYYASKGFAGLYLHQRSSLHLSRTRAYSSF
ncbi:MAG: hypothetical protein ACREJM_12630, partial [Candidatus Saccharimonadales bacterium]